MAARRSSKTDFDFAEQIGRMTEALNRGVQDRKELLTAIDKLDGSIDGMNGVLSEMRAAFAGMIRRMEELEKDGDRCEKLEARVVSNENRLKSLEDWRTNRKRITMILATLWGGVGSVGISILWEIVKAVFHFH